MSDQDAGNSGLPIPSEGAPSELDQGGSEAEYSEAFDSSQDPIQNQGGGADSVEDRLSLIDLRDEVYALRTDFETYKRGNEILSTVSNSIFAKKRSDDVIKWSTLAIAICTALVVAVSYSQLLSFKQAGVQQQREAAHQQEALEEANEILMDVGVGVANNAAVGRETTSHIDRLAGPEFKILNAEGNDCASIHTGGNTFRIRNLQGCNIYHVKVGNETDYKGEIVVIVNFELLALTCSNEGTVDSFGVMTIDIRLDDCFQIAGEEKIGTQQVNITADFGEIYL